ncbi:hypothetical protein KGF57_004906 [Candida theae]|uniref:Uncharacterized protein n=1 Tax=Candida theae TaxID=1198502 RepID=A0AAD5FWM9_9ASCO|nr:uncharacterized protein KGF57_004906 [Candida theae]KAI5949076.1 hypothetical protein KGF57_004906 [Candida theae]
MFAVTIILVSLATIYTILKLLNYLKTVPDLYLQQQSYPDPTRLPNESPIYHSTKSPTGLRLGLDIRYDHYKIRRGNCNDIWEIAMRKQKGNREVEGGRANGIYIRGKFVEFATINYYISQWDNFKYDAINIPVDHQVDAHWVIVVLICLIKQVPLQFYDAKLKPETGTLISEIKLPPPQQSHDFNNVYSVEKDKGIAIEFHKVVKLGIDVVVKFTQLNLISAVASSIKHLPAEYNATGKSMTIVPSSDFAGVSNTIVKLLMAFVCQMEVHIDETPRFNTEITCLPESKTLLTDLSWIQNIKLQFLKMGIFSSTKLAYVHSSISHPRLTSSQLNHLRILTNSHVIREYYTYNIMGPLLTTDYYEYRTYTRQFGAMPQSLEMKVNNLSGDGVGNLLVRGYTIGKSTNYLNGVEQQQQQNANSQGDGFMPVNARGKWGTDGCFYLI